MQNKMDRLIRAILICFVLAAVVWAYSVGTLDYIKDHVTVLLLNVQQHLQLVAISSVLAIAFSIPVGILITRPRFKKFAFVFINFANIGQTVPGLAVLALAMSFLGLGTRPAIFALWLYSLLPILRNTTAGIENVNKSILDAGKGMGMTPAQIFWKLEFPNALYAISGGIRTSVVINVGSATLAFLIGGGGLGDPIFTGIALDDTGMMLSGAILTVLIAFTIDMVLGRIEKIVIPKGLQGKIQDLNII